MSLKDQLSECIKDNNIVYFCRLLDENNTAELLPLLQDELYSIALFNSFAIANRALEIPEVLAHLRTNHSALHLFVHTAMRSVDASFFSRLLEIDFIRAEIINNPHEYVLAAAKNRKAAAEIYDVLKFMINLEENVITENYQAWFCAHVEYNYAAKNKMLELYPAVYEFVEAQDPNHHCGQDYINYRFMEYYFAKLKERVSEKLSFDVNANEAKLCYLVLKTLVRTYSKREQIQKHVDVIKRNSSHIYSESLPHKAKDMFMYLYTKYSGKENIHLERIKMLLAIPSVLRRVSGDNNLLLAMSQAQGEGSLELTELLKCYSSDAPKATAVSMQIA